MKTVCKTSPPGTAATVLTRRKRRCRPAFPSCLTPAAELSSLTWITPYPPVLTRLGESSPFLIRSSAWWFPMAVPRLRSCKMMAPAISLSAPLLGQQDHSLAEFLQGITRGFSPGHSGYHVDSGKLCPAGSDLLPERRWQFRSAHNRLFHGGRSGVHEYRGLQLYEPA